MQALFVFLTIYKKQFMSTVGLGYLTTGTFNQNSEPIILPMDESVCGMIFDYSDFDSPFDNFSDAEQSFGDGQVQLINNLEEAENVGIWDNDFMSGLPYYHVKAYYDYIGEDAPLYVCFTKDYRKWSAIEKMQMEAGGKLFNVGIWTSKPLWTANGSIQFTSLCGNVEAAAEALSGKLGRQTMSYCPVSILLCPSTSISDYNQVRLSNLPYGINMNCPKVSVSIVQDNSNDVVSMQSKLPNNATVGCLGILMACVHLAYAEENIGYVAKFNLNKNDNFTNAGVYLGNKFVSVSKLQPNIRLAISRGYIVPVEYDGKEAEVFFSGDSTFSNGDYYCLANNRVMHKVRRAAQSALIPYISSNYMVKTDSGELSASSQAILIDAVSNMIDNCMLNKDKQSQITGKSILFTSSENILQNDEITLHLAVQPINYSNVINERDSFQI